MQQEVRAQSQQLAIAAGSIEAALADQTRNAEASESKNDVAFVISLIPLAVAIFGFMIGKGE